MKIFLTLLCLALVAGVRAENLPASPRPPDTAPLFAATLWSTDNQAYALEKLRGKPLVVNFWARWCGPCRAEIPELTRIQQRMKDKGLVVVGIGLEDKADTVREFARAYDMDYLVLLAKGQGNSLLHALGSPKGGLPFTLVIDTDGRVVAKKLGLISRAELDAAVAALFR